MLHCPTYGCSVSWSNSPNFKRRERDQVLAARAKHVAHTFPFKACISSIDVNPARGFDPRGARYILRRLAS